MLPGSGMRAQKSLLCRRNRYRNMPLNTSTFNVKWELQLSISSTVLDISTCIFQSGHKICLKVFLAIYYYYFFFYFSRLQHNSCQSGLHPQDHILLLRTYLSYLISSHICFYCSFIIFLIFFSLSVLTNIVHSRSQSLQVKIVDLIFYLTSHVSI